MKRIIDFLRRVIKENADSRAFEWLESKIERFTDQNDHRKFILTYGQIPRKFARTSVEISAERLTEGNSIRKDFRPVDWSLHQWIRTYLLLHMPYENATAFADGIELLFDTADMNEQVALYSALPILPFAEEFKKRATEGLRTNITPVFDSIALNNVYPSEQFSENEWNQMVLKAAFMDRPIYKIIGIDDRANAKLARIISDYAHERWAAGRVVSPELWRPVGSFLDERLITDIQKLSISDDEIQQKAAALVCSDSDEEDAQKILEMLTSHLKSIKTGGLTWDSLGREWWKMKEN